LSGGQDRVAHALERAKDDACTLPAAPREEGRARVRRVAIGDPQAPLGRFLEILDAHGLLGEGGRLAPDVLLVSMGDHFDFGGRETRAAAADSGTQLLAWLAAHPADQVVLLLGNHDLARVGELVRFDDASFGAAQSEADAAYFHGQPDRPEELFRARYGVPSWEVVARDFGTFRVEQRTLVSALLQTHRFRTAFAAGPDLLLTHAGVTRDELDALGLPGAAHADARSAAAALNDALDTAVGAWSGGPLAVPDLHEPGNASREGLGMFFHRPVRKEGEEEKGVLRRRFDVRRLPAGLTQAVGHIHDKKCRELLGAPPEGQKNGPLRHLRVKGDALAYARGTPRPDEADDRDAATMIFLDGAMSDAPVGDYELLDLVARAKVAH
jgi:hypothetical protein